MILGSFVRFYFAAGYVIAIILMIILFISSNEYVAITCVVLFAFLSFSIFFIKCENCGAIMYRRDKKTHGFPVYKWENAIKETNCPCCGVYRYGFWDGLSAFFSQKDKS